MKRVYEKGFKVEILRGTVRRQTKKRFNSFSDRKWIRKVIKDSYYFDSQLCETLIIADPETKDEFTSIVNAHLELEAMMQIVSVEPKVYVPGEARNIFGYGESETLRKM